MSRNVAVVMVLFAIACASQPSGTATGAPDVVLSQTSQMPMHGAVADPRSGIPVTYRLEITNPFDYPVTLVSVEIESVGTSGAYALRRVRHAFSQVIPPRSKESLDFRAWVHRLQVDTRGQSDSPVNLRGTARFESEAGVMRRNFVARGQ